MGPAAHRRLILELPPDFVSAAVHRAPARPVFLATPDTFEFSMAQIFRGANFPGRKFSGAIVSNRRVRPVVDLRGASFADVRRVPAPASCSSFLLQLPAPASWCRAFAG
jgi:hypothetical protein